MKLLYITNGVDGSGGLERVLSIKASYLADVYDYDVTILTLNGKNDQLFFEFSKKINFVDVVASKKNTFNYFYEYWHGINKKIKEIKPDVISVCDDGLKGMLFPFLFGRKIPVIYERHVSREIQLENTNLSFIHKVKLNTLYKLMKFGGSRFHKFVVLTKGNLKEWQLNNLAVIPNPLPFKTTEASNLSSKRVLVVGKQSYQKGYDRLIQIWKLVHEKYSDWKLEVYGKLDPSLGLEKLVDDLGLLEVIHFFPPIKNIQEKYKEASIYLMTSRFEGFGMVLIEAMSHGVPCISFDCPHGPADIITNNEDGFLVENGNTELFSEKVKELIQDEEKRMLFGNRARQNLAKYGIKSIAAQWDQLFKSIIASR